jgi:glycosyltransferase involved in cell wall biosynthesis
MMKLTFNINKVNINKVNINKVLTLIITSLARPRALNNLLNSIKPLYPKIPIIISDDSEYLTKIDPSPNTHHLHTGFQNGVSYGRNMALQNVETKYFVTLDDDFEFINKLTDLDMFVYLIQKHKLDILCGTDFKGSRLFCPYSLKFYHNNKKLIKHILPWSEGEITRTDMGPNFFIAETSVIKSIGGWDNQFKYTREHIDFFLNVMYNDLKVGCTQKIKCRHRHFRYPKKIRGRNKGNGKSGRIIFNKKHGLRRVVRRNLL